MAYSYDRRAAAYSSKIEFEVKSLDGERAVLRVLKFLRFIGSAGASRSICVENKDRDLAFWDGDGADSMGPILLNGQEVEMSEDERQDFNDLIR